MATRAAAFNEHLAHHSEPLADCVWCPEAPVEVEWSKPLRSLSGLDIGKVVTFRIGGATYKGRLDTVEHGGYGTEKVWIVLRGDDGWSHMAAHPADTTIRGGLLIEARS